MLFLLIFSVAFQAMAVDPNERPSEDVPTRNEKIEGSANHSKPVFVKYGKMHKSTLKPAGSYVTLKCKSYGNPTPNITWYKDDQLPSQRNLGEYKYSNWSFTMEDLVTADTGKYKCVICNYLGCINYTHELEVIEVVQSRPILLGDYNNMTVEVGDSFNTTCRVYANSLNIHIQWVRGRFDAPQVNTSQQEGLGPTGNPEILEIQNVTHKDEGWYTCIAANSLGHTLSSAYLKVVDTIEPEPNSLSLLKLLMIVISVICVVVIIIFCGVFFQKYQREKHKNMIAVIEAQWTKKVTVEKMHSTMDNVSEPLLMPIVKIEKQKSQNNNSADGLVTEYELPMDSDWEIPRELLMLGESLGEGAFGKVIKAEGNGIQKPGADCIVAVKMLKEGHTDNEMMDLVSEMEMMKMIGKHINIINLLGCCTQGGPLFVVVEYAPYGNLRDFLRQHRPSSGYEPAIGIIEKEKRTLTQKDLVSFAYQVARGMEYLASRRCIHRDLAARNVLVSDEYILKIADFGLARDIHCNDYYRKTTDGRLPVKWMAPEALFHRVYTTQSDVWSYGILLWEIMTLGGTPYPSVPSVEKLFQLLRSGHRMEKPPCCSLEIYMLMRECWSYQPNERPTFSELVEDLDRILTITANEEYLDLGLPQLDTPPSSQESSGDESFPY